MLVSFELNRSLPLSILGLLLLTAALMAAIWAHLPLVNGPQEWQWAYRPAGLAPGGLAAALAGAALVLLGAAGGAEKWRLPALLAGGAAFTFGLTAAQPGGFGRVLDSLVSRNSFGFVWDAGLAPDRRRLLADYPAASQGLNQHSVTHPPGPLLAVRALDRLVARLAPARPAPSLTERAERAIARARMRAGYHGQPVPQRLPGPWTVVALALLLPAASVLAAWPLHRLALACGLGRPAALLAAALWMVVPARSLFTPSLDQALPLLLLTAAWLAAKPGLWRAAGAGLVLWCACFLSYGCLAALPIVAALMAGSTGASLATGPDGRWQLRPVLARLAALGSGFLLPWIALALGAGFDPWTAFRTALRLHHEIAVAPRGYGTWLAWNPWDFALLAGPPVLLLAAAARDAARRPAMARGLGATLGALYWSFWSFWVVMAALWLSGSARGEVGRIWLPWMPFACLLAAGAVERWAEKAAALEGHPAAERPTEALGGEGLSAAARGILLAQAALAVTLAANLIFVS
jgi:hypothetical protein